MKEAKILILLAMLGLSWMIYIEISEHSLFFALLLIILLFIYALIEQNESKTN